MNKALRWLWERAGKIIRPLSYLCFLVAFIAELWLIFKAPAPIQDRFLLPITLLLSAFMATCGWLWSGYVNRRLSRKNNALQLLCFIRSDQMNAWKSDVYLNTKSTEATASEETFSVSAQKLLGVYEFISICVMNGTIDEEMIEQSQRYIFLKIFRRLETHINESVKETADMYCHFIHYTKKWNKEEFEVKPRLIRGEGEF